MTPEEAIEIVRALPQVVATRRTCLSETACRYLTAIETVTEEHDRLINENNSLAARVRDLYNEVGYLEDRVDKLEDELDMHYEGLKQ